MSDKKPIFIVKIYLTTSNVILAGFRDLDWGHTGGRISNLTGEHISEEEFVNLKSKEFPEIEFARLDLLPEEFLLTITTISIIK